MKLQQCPGIESCQAGLHSVSACFTEFCCGTADKQYVHIMLHYINSQGDVLNCSLTGKSSGSGYSVINPVALRLQADKLPHQTFDIQQLVAAEKVLINVLLISANTDIS